MPAYLIVNVDVLKPEEYEEYKLMVPVSIKQYGGRYLARGGKCGVLEGTYQPKRMAIVEFPDAERARAWWASPEYAEAKALRHRLANTDLIILEGL